MDGKANIRAAPLRGVARARAGRARRERHARRRLPAADARLLLGGRRLRGLTAHGLRLAARGADARRRASSASCALGVASLLPGRRARLAQVGLAIDGGAGRAALLVWPPSGRSGTSVRFVAWRTRARSSRAASSPLWQAPRRAPTPRRPGRLVYVGGRMLVAAALLPIVVGWRLAGRPPPAIRAEMARTPPGQVTVVDFVDFECPFCRMTNAALQPLLDAHQDRLRVVRRQVPLRMHPHALDAARAACCGERLGRGDAMASALFSAPVESLTREGCEKSPQADRALARRLPRLRRRPEDRRRASSPTGPRSRTPGASRCRRSGSTATRSSARSRGKPSKRSSWTPWPMRAAEPRAMRAGATCPAGFLAERFARTAP